MEVLENPLVCPSPWNRAFFKSIEVEHLAQVESEKMNSLIGYRLVQ